METAVAQIESEENAVEQEKARIKAEAERKQQELIQARFDRLESIGMSMAGGMYRLPWNPEGMALPQALIQSCTDEQFESFSSRLNEEVEKENARKAEAERQEALRPDKEKILAFAFELEKLKFPEVGMDAEAIIKKAQDGIAWVIKGIRKATKEL